MVAARKPLATCPLLPAPTSSLTVAARKPPATCDLPPLPLLPDPPCSLPPVPIVSCTIPAFPLSLLARGEPGVWQRPLAALDTEERVLCATPPAQAAGVRAGQTARQARVACPELHMHAVDLPQARSEFEALLCLFDDYADAVEPAALGRAYLAAPDLDERTAAPFCQELGRAVRRGFGPALQPAIGCDQGKFTAGAAAQRTRPGAVRVVLGAAEQPFLRPLPVSLLPLTDDQQRFLGYLGIHTLGQFAALPATAVFQQWGAPGRLAQRWAQGQDDRPVIPRQKRPTYTRSLAFDPPLETLAPLLAGAERLLAPVLTRLRDHLQAAQALRATLQWVDGSQQVDDRRLPAPTTDARRLLAPLAAGWQAAAWTQPVAGLVLTLGEVQEAPGDQFTLFPGAGAPSDLLAAALAPLQLRYGPGCFLRAEVPDALGLRVEQRARWQEYEA